jgi:hypothetical protein
LNAGSSAAPGDDGGSSDPSGSTEDDSTIDSSGDDNEQQALREAGLEDGSVAGSENPSEEDDDKESDSSSMSSLPLPIDAEARAIKKRESKEKKQMRKFVAKEMKKSKRLGDTQPVLFTQTHVPPKLDIPVTPAKVETFRLAVYAIVAIYPMLNVWAQLSPAAQQIVAWRARDEYPDRRKYRSNS